MRTPVPPALPRYVLVTPARNEAAFIGKTIASVIAQTARPVKWVIVSDDSTDGTDEIVRRFAAKHDWIELVTGPASMKRNFAGKVAAFTGPGRQDEGLEDQNFLSQEVSALSGLKDCSDRHLRAKFKDGGKSYSVGAAPLWELFRTVYRMTKQPFVVSSPDGGVWLCLGADTPGGPASVPGNGRLLQTRANAATQNAADGRLAPYQPVT